MSDTNKGCDRCGMYDRAEGSTLCVHCAEITSGKNTHTPGPWSDGFAIQSLSTGQPVCRVISTAKWSSKQDALKFGCGGFANQTDEETAQANARLIAAAPAMLEALKEILRQAANCNARQHAGLEVMPEHWAALFDAQSAAYAVVSKAEGRAE